jgi:hypothetical protein
MEENLPFEYHDIAMDHVITESGVVVGAPEKAGASSGSAGNVSKFAG